MKILFPRLCTCIALFIFTLTVNAQTERQLEIADLIKKELGINEILIPHKGDTNLFFDYEEFLCYVYPGSNYIRIHVTARSADPNIFLYKRSNSNLEKKVIQVFKQHINEVNKKYHITKAYWSIYEEPHFQVLSTFSTSIPMDANDAWISDLKETITSTGISMKLFKEKLVMSLSKICWEVKENETDPDVLREAIFWAKY
ncbi:MAG: hypothetical protein HRT69_12585, partial [Flavobacteriaceae bacterium]|nr:hypothetical protein [Flavobacteriaceae bacterium]